MKKFRFRLEKIEKLRRDAEKRAQRALAEAKIQETRERDKLEALRAEAAARRCRMRELTSKRVDPERLRSNTDYIHQLDFLTVHQEKRVHQAADRVSGCREKLEKASKEVKKLERLQEIKREQFNKETESLLQKENDETAANVGRGRTDSS